MTIESRLSCHADLYNNPEWPNFFERRSLHQPRIAAVCINLDGLNSGYVTRILSNIIFDLSELLELEILGFHATATYQPKTRISNHNKIWKSVPDFSTDGVEFGKEAIIEIEDRKSVV